MCGINPMRARPKPREKDYATLTVSIEGITPYIPHKWVSRGCWRPAEPKSTKRER